MNTDISKKIDRSSPVPLYEQIKADIRRGIIINRMQAGTMLPTENDLCSRFGVSRITVVRALNDLAAEGVVERVQGKGTLVASPHIDVQMTSFAMGFSAAMRAQGMEVHTKILSHKTVPGNARLYTIFGLSPTREMEFIQLQRLRFIQGRPVVLTRSTVGTELGLELLKHNLEDASLYGLYEKITGSHVVGSEETVGIVHVEDEEARLLQVPAYSSHFTLQGCSFQEGHIPIEATESIFRGDVFRFQVDMTHLIFEPHSFAGAAAI